MLGNRKEKTDNKPSNRMDSGALTQIASEGGGLQAKKLLRCYTNFC